MKTSLLSLIALLCVALVFNAVPAHAEGLIVNDVTISDIAPGEETQLRITLKNTFSDSLEDVSLALNLQGLPLSIVGSSESTLDEINDGDKEDFVFRIRASSTAKPGDYSIPYTLSTPNATKPKTGTIGIRIKGDVQLSTLVTAETPVLNQKGKLSLKLVNKGLADARYVSVTLAPNGFTLLSEQTVYIGDISANDFETATFDVRYTSTDPVATARIEYRDFNNVVQTKTLAEPFLVYTQDEAIKQGILAKNNAPLYIGVILALLVLWLIWRSIRKRRRMRKSMQSAAR